MDAPHRQAMEALAPHRCDTCGEAFTLRPGRPARNPRTECYTCRPKVSGKHATCCYCTRPSNGHRFCTPACADAHAWDRRGNPLTFAECMTCARPFARLSTERTKGYCTTDCKAEATRQQQRARYDKDRERVKWTRRRLAIKQTDLTRDAVLALFKTTKTCPLCTVPLTNTKGPAQAQLDHIVPINIGGTHTAGNVRVICRTCNLKRPKDGSDVTEQTTLWSIAAASIFQPRGASISRAADPAAPSPSPFPSPSS